MNLRRIGRATASWGADARHVIHISLDGGRGDLIAAMLAADTTGELANLRRFVDEGAVTWNARTDASHTITLPNHTTMVTARPVTQPAGQPNTVHHGYTSNSDPAPTTTLHNSGNLNVAYKASVFDVAHDAGMSTALYASKSKFSLFDHSYDAADGAADLVPPDNGTDKIDRYLYLAAGSTAAAMHAAFLSEMAANRLQLLLRPLSRSGRGGSRDRLGRCDLAIGSAHAGRNVYARFLGGRLQEAMGQPFVVENRPGAGAVTGTDIVAKAAPDGYTLLVMSNTETVNETLIPNKPYALLRDFVPVAPINYSDLVLVVNPTVAARTLPELIALVNSQPGKLNYASPGPGTPYHMAGELFKAMGGLDIVHVPYKESSAARTGVLGGQVEMMFDAVTTMSEQAKAGKVRALASSGRTRSSVTPDLPTVAEAGVPGYEAVIWLGTAHLVNKTVGKTWSCPPAGSEKNKY